MIVELLVAILSTYGVVLLFTEYEGPFRVFDRLYGLLRRYFNTVICAVCLSVWTAIIPSLVLHLGILEYLAVVGGVILLIRIDEQI